MTFTPAAATVQRSMLDRFQGRRPATNKEIAAAIKSGLITMDANVLLRFYRYTHEINEEWAAILAELGDRLWFSAQAMHEFWKNRHVSAARATPTEAAQKKIVTHLRALSEAHGSWVREMKRNESSKITELLASVSEAFDELFVEEITTHNERFKDDPSEDEVVKILVKLIDDQDARQRASIGDEFTDQEYQAARREADRRIREEVPPGYLDATKKDGAGDYFVWEQVLVECTRRQMDAGNEKKLSYLVLVTDDAKDDWWQDYRVTANRPTRIPRSELVEEAWTRAGVKYIQLSASEFLKHASAAFNVELGQSTVSLVEAVDFQTAAQSRNGQQFSIRDQTGVRAQIDFSNEDGSCILLSGSAISSDHQGKNSGNALRKLKSLLQQGAVVKQETGSDFDVLKDVWLTSPDLAATLVIGRASEGRKEWINGEGQSLGDYIEMKRRSISEGE